MEAVDWLGNLLSCRDCPHGEIRKKGLCDLGQRSSRAAHRPFFRPASPRKTTKYLSHLYFEMRVGAAKNANVFQLRALIDDEESGRQAKEAQRLSPHLAEKPISEPDRKVRTVMARRAPPDIFANAMRDDDAQVHDEAARSAGAHDYCRAVGAAGPIGVVRRRRRLESPLSLGGAAFGGFARAAARRSRSGSKAPRHASLEEAQQ